MRNESTGNTLSRVSASSPWPLLRWFGASATLSMPQAAAPVALSLVALGLTGEANGGAAMILAMTIAQVFGVIPITRLGKNWSASAFLRALIGFRTLALAMIALCAHLDAPFFWLVIFAALAGLVNGAAFGYLRSLLNQFTDAPYLPRALGIAATLNEVTFVLGPVIASGLGAVSPVFAVLALTLIGGLPAVLIPHAEKSAVMDEPQAGGAVLGPAILLWLACSASGGAVVAAVEIGAVALALKYGYDATYAILFTVPLCLASVAGGVWVSLRNRVVARKTVVALLAVMSFGAGLAALGPSLASVVIGAILIGCVLAPLGTWYSIALDQLAPRGRRAEVFALLRTANAVGVIYASTVLTAVSVTSALFMVTGSMILVTGLAGIVTLAEGNRLNRAG